MPELMTNDSLLQRLAAAAGRGVSADESRAQRLSFVYGNLPKGSTMTKLQVQEVLERMDRTDGRR